MTTRRGFVAGLLATSMAPAPSWADIGKPDFLSAARRPDGSYILAGLSALGEITFSVPLPDRGHAAAAHPLRPEAVAFARRPGTFALVIDCRSGNIISKLDSPSGRHFYGHGVYSPDASVLFTTENDFENGTGRIGVWDVKAGYKRISDFASGGIGPHDMALLPDGETLIVANGGIQTHPNSGRSKLNIATMRSNLAYISVSGTLKERLELEPTLARNSIRHLSVDQSGTVAFAMQWQGPTSEHPPLLGTHRIGTKAQLLSAPKSLHKQMQGYAGSIAYTAKETQISISSPHGGQVQIFDAATGKYLKLFREPDVSGIGMTNLGMMITTGAGRIVICSNSAHNLAVGHELNWDNHLIRLK